MIHGVRDLRALVGSPVPLFDRLVDGEPERRYEERPLRVLTGPELVESVERELNRLLNTRGSRRSVKLPPDQRTVLDYGLPDFSGRFSGSEVDRQWLAEQVVETIRAFEPRLHEPVAEVLPRDPSSGAEGVRLEIGGEVRQGTFMEPVSFPLTIESPAPGGR